MKINYILLIVILIFLFSCVSKFEERIEYYPSGQIYVITHLRDGKLDGKYFYYHENGQIGVIGNNKENKPHGKWEYYYPNGQLKAIQFYDDGELVNFDHWTEDGEQNIKDGTGNLNNYDEFGNLIGIENFKNSKLNGKCIYYHENGEISHIKFYKMGTPDSTWMFWDENGKLLETRKY
jgi:antitoxin component YwqK of YwqJK toxin-antitoxin module